MISLRRALRRIAVTWLVCQVAALSLAPIVSWSGPVRQLLECQCSHGDHAVCPMHHKPAPGSKICLLQNAGDTNPAVFTWLLNAGVMPATPWAAVAGGHSRFRPGGFRTAAERPAPPDPPPPRA
jgi:hypothetical protein